MKRTQAEKVIDAFMLGNYYPSKGDKLRYDSSNECIYDNTGTLIAEFKSLEDYYGNYKIFLVINDLTLKYNNTWEKYKKDLARAANDAGIRVVLEQLDIGFGIQPTIVDKNELAKHMIKIAKYSQDEDIQTACRISSNSYCIYSYNQKIDGEMLHAEEVAFQYVSMSFTDSYRQHEHVYCLYEPCYDCLDKISTYAETIIINHVHKKKWETHDYRTLFFNLKTNRTHNTFDRRVFIEFDKNKYVDKFYEGKV